MSEYSLYFSQKMLKLEERLENSKNKLEKKLNWSSSCDVKFAMA